MVISNLKFSEIGGEGAFGSEIAERGFLENLDKNLLFEECVQKPACASQIVSHILRMWRPTRDHCGSMLGKVAPGVLSSHNICEKTFAWMHILEIKALFKIPPDACCAIVDEKFIDFMHSSAPTDRQF